MTDMKVVGIDIGGTHFRVGTVDASGAVADFQKMPVKQVFCGTDPLGDLCAFLSSYCNGARIDAISIGFPATLDARRQKVLQAPNISFMEDLPVVEVLERALGIPVFIERDVTFSLVYDRRKYGLPEEGIHCGIYFGTGIGNAITIDGRPLVGKNGTAGEIGHIPVDGNTIKCGCGNTGCMETVAGGKYLAHLCKTVYTDTHISELFTKHANEPLLQQFVDRMAIAVATEINILDPDVVLVGGGVPNMPGFPREELNRRILARTRKPLPAQRLTIVYTEDAQEKCVVGAALYAMERLQC